MSLDHLRSFLEAAGDSVCARPVFVIGSPRSGTTALARALGRHPELWTSHESYVLHHLYGNGRVRRAWRQDAERRQAPSWIKTEEVGHQELLGFLGTGVNALYTSRSGGRRWIDQTPLNTLMVEDLAEMFPGAQFVHALRDGRHVVHSMSNFMRKFENRPEATRYVPAWAGDFAEACRTWRRWVETAASFCAGNPERGTTVVMERLSAEPRRAFEALYRFLGLEWDPGPVELMTSQRLNSSFANEGRGQNPSSPGSFPRWDDERRLIFAEECSQVLLAHGLAQRSELQAWLAGSSPASPDEVPAGG